MANMIYVGSLSSKTTRETLKAAFSKFGEIVSVGITRDPVNGYSKGFGFIAFAESSSAEKAVSEMNGQELDGRTLKVIHYELERPNPPNDFRSKRKF